MTLIQLLESKDEALNAQQVAELLGISKKKVYEMAATGKLPSFRVGQAVRFDGQDLAEWLRKKKHLDEQVGPANLRKGQRTVSTKRNRETSSSGHLWRKKVNSLEAALGMDSLNDNSIKAS